MRRAIFLTLVFFCFGTDVAKPQKRVTIAHDTARFNQFSGRVSYSALSIHDTLFIKNGSFEFSSSMSPQFQNDTIFIKGFSAKGSFSKNKKNQSWVYSEYDIVTKEFSFSETPRLELKYALRGKETKFLTSYNNSLRTGNWEQYSRQIDQNRFGKAILTAQMPFRNDTLTGSFLFNPLQNGIPLIEARGSTNKEGFLDGKVILIYSQEGLLVRETRDYTDGFLLRLIKQNTASGDILLEVNYTDVRQSLQKIAKREKGLHYQKGNIGFGILFDNGYRDTDEKQAAQEPGNSYLYSAFSLFDDVAASFGDDLSPTSVGLKLTRRFRYLYPAYEDSLFKTLNPIALKLYQDINRVVEMPNLVLRKDNSDSLAYQYAWLLHCQSKAEKVYEVISKVINGYFDYRYRDNFYANGLKGLSAPDSVIYRFGGMEKRKLFNVNYFITSPDSLPFRLKTYLSVLDSVFREGTEDVSRRLIVYENQEIIDSLDKAIVRLSKRLDSTYSDKNYLLSASSEKEKTPFAYKAFQSFSERLILPLRARYINPELTQNEVIDIGKEITALLSFLCDSKSSFDEIERMPQFWNDSLFTLYRDNPFDFRKLETKILSGTQQAATILLRNYATNLLNAKSSEAAIKDFNSIQRLNKRVLYIRNNFLNESVKLLDESLRRERVPIRIERLLEI